MKPPQIAIIGTEGSGKTVLTTVLAKKLTTPLNGVWLNPQGAKTGKYIENTWNTLCRGEWVPSTPPGTLFELSWKLQAGERECPMRMIDSAGQDLRRVFSDDGFNDPNLSDQDRRFIEYIQNSTILLVLINLRDFLGEADENRVIENGFILKAVLDKLKEDREKRQMVFVFTAYDLYEKTIEENYGTIEKFVEKKLPYLQNAYIAGKSVNIFPVAAVAETEERVLENGVVQIVPAPKFRSRGLDPLIQWLAAAVVGDIEAQEQQEAEEAAAVQQQQIAEQEAEERQKRTAARKPFLKISLAVLGIIVCGIFLLPLLSSEKAIAQVDEWSWGYHCSGVLGCPLTDGHTASATIPIKNVGHKRGGFTVTVSIGNKSGNENVYLNPGEKKIVPIKIKPDTHTGNETVSCDVSPLQ